jgi:hypothetical protein
LKVRRTGSSVRSVPPHRDADVEGALLDRAERAVEAAADIRARSEVIVSVSAALRASDLTTRCAWCSRYRVQGLWVLVEPPPEFGDRAGITHGICEECVAELRATGMSV